MVDISKSANEVLDEYWLSVWHNLIERYWDYIRKPDEDHDIYYLKGVCSKPCYTFASMRKRTSRSKESIDEEVISLANDFWERNRLHVKEYFINSTCHIWDKELAVEKDLNGGWIDGGIDPAYPNGPTKSPYDALCLSYTGEFQNMLIDAMKDARIDVHMHKMTKCIKENFDKKYEETRKNIINRFIDFVSNAFHKVFQQYIVLNSLKYDIFII